MPPASMRLLTHNRGKKETTRKGHDKQSATKKRTQTKTTDTNPNGGWHPMYCSARREKDGERQLRVDSSNGASATAGDRGASSLTFLFGFRVTRQKTPNSRQQRVCSLSPSTSGYCFVTSGGTTDINTDFRQMLERGVIQGTIVQGNF